MNLGLMKTALKRYGFNDDDPLVDWINAALHEFDQAYSWPFLEAETTINVAAGQNEVIVPGDFAKLRSLKFDGQVLRPDYLPFGEFEETVIDRTTPGLPTVFTLVGLEKIILWPTPDQPLVVRFGYRKQVGNLTTDTDTPDIPTQHHYTIVLRAASIALDAENEEDRATKAQDQWEAGLIRAIGSYTDKQEQQPDSVKDTAGYFDNWPTV